MCRCAAPAGSLRLPPDGRSRWSDSTGVGLGASIPGPADRRAVDHLAPSCTGGRRSAGRRQRRSRPARELARRQPVVGRAFRPNRVARARERLGGAGVHRLEPGDPTCRRECSRLPARRRSSRVRPGTPTESIRRGEAVVCVVRPFRRRPPHRRPQRLHLAPRQQAIVRGIQLFHVQGNGWNDIGYNFLVDRSGTSTKAATAGSSARRRCARAGFDTGSVGVARIGTFEQGAPPAAA